MCSNPKTFFHSHLLIHGSVCYQPYKVLSMFIQNHFPFNSRVLTFYVWNINKMALNGFKWHQFLKTFWMSSQKNNNIAVSQLIDPPPVAINSCSSWVGHDLSVSHHYHHHYSITRALIMWYVNLGSSGEPTASHSLFNKLAVWLQHGLV